MAYKIFPKRLVCSRFDPHLVPLTPGALSTPSITADKFSHLEGADVLSLLQVNINILRHLPTPIGRGTHPTICAWILQGMLISHYVLSTPESTGIVPAVDFFLDTKPLKYQVKEPL